MRVGTYKLTVCVCYIAAPEISFISFVFYCCCCFFSSNNKLALHAYAIRWWWWWWRRRRRRRWWWGRFASDPWPATYQPQLRLLGLSSSLSFWYLSNYLSCVSLGKWSCVVKFRHGYGGQQFAWPPIFFLTRYFRMTVMPKPTLVACLMGASRDTNQQQQQQPPFPISPPLNEPSGSP